MGSSAPSGREVESRPAFSLLLLGCREQDVVKHLPPGRVAAVSAMRRSRFGLRAFVLAGGCAGAGAGTVLRAPCRGHGGSTACAVAVRARGASTKALLPLGP